MCKEEANNITDIWQIDINTRWRLYLYWISLHCQRLKNSVTELNEEYRNISNMIREVSIQKDKMIMSEMTIIAMTTTGAARYQNILQEINPRIIIVEEAAEVLEGHIITSLTRGCEQLILIGDHKQLRPNPTVYQLATKYNLQVSLFERLLNNGFHYDCLEIQHRMRPEISRLLKPIYPKLQDHESVKSFDNVMGLSTNIFFIDHKFEEEHDEEITSHSNQYEAEYLCRFTEYLLKQGYKPNQITILTAYSGQLFQLQNLMPKKFFKDLCITSIDNFQGEENDVILLSLVRSNPRKNLGFLKIDNRVCVALSRAKKGLYVIGNFEMLASQSKLWKEITDMLKETNQLGEILLLTCQNHPEDPGVKITCPEDFNKAPFGGCIKLCNARLDCGHSCPMNCHPIDPDHKYYKCQKPCTKLCKEGHVCRKKCCENWKDCRIKVERIIPSCGHTDLVPCYRPVSEHKCTNPCNKILDCGHKCCNGCGYPHQCNEVVNIELPCGHTADVKCTEQDIAVCKIPCQKQLKCGHQCQGTECSSRRHHNQCIKPVNIKLLCGHTVYDKCKEKDRAVCRSPCQKQLKCGHQCQGTCSECSSRRHHNQCIKLVNIKLLCGHTADVKCTEKDTAVCILPCQKQLKCGHQCQGTCSECSSGRLHKPCQNKCTEILLCGHYCQSNCSTCLPCKMKCENQCEHRKCKKSCGEICIKCEEPCTWRCEHFKCSKKCHEPCDRPPCNRPCTKQLESCNHPCIGLCGEPCPTLCRICDSDDVIRLLFGSDIQPDDRFIELKECGHVFEYKSLDKWMNQDTSQSSSIKLKSCPICETTIRRCVRYGSIINCILENIIEVKKRYIRERKVLSLMKQEKYSYILKLTKIPGITESKLVSYKNEIDYVMKLSNNFEKLKFKYRSQLMHPENKKKYEQLEKELKHLRDLKRSVRTDQMVSEAQAEFSRLSLYLEFFDGVLMVEKEKVEIDDTTKHGVKLCHDYFECGLPLTTYQHEMIKSTIKQLNKFCTKTDHGILQDKPLNIVKVVQMRKCNWYRCKNGHIYAVEDCVGDSQSDGSMQEIKCPTCKEANGQSTQLMVESNENDKAGEKDGAQNAV